VDKIVELTTCKLSQMNININFQAPSLKRNEYFSIFKDINEHLKELEGQFGNIKSVEIKLYDTMADNTNNDKALMANIKFENESFTEYRISNRWDKVISDVFYNLKLKNVIRNIKLNLAN
jgi:hypothetical protein